MGDVERGQELVREREELSEEEMGDNSAWCIEGQTSGVLVNGRFDVGPQLK